MNKLELYHHGIFGQKWGVRRYQNEDGTLTEEGKRRYATEVAKNNAKKKDDRIKDLDKNDPNSTFDKGIVNRWVTEDIKSVKTITDSSNDIVKVAKEFEKSTTPPPKKAERLDLSNMSDKELRDLINRETLERQYNNLFNNVSESQVSKGREKTREILETGGAVLSAASAAIGIILAIKTLSGR